MKFWPKTCSQKEVNELLQLTKNVRVSLLYSMICSEHLGISRQIVHAVLDLDINPCS